MTALQGVIEIVECPQSDQTVILGTFLKLPPGTCLYGCMRRHKHDAEDVLGAVCDFQVRTPQRLVMRTKGVSMLPEYYR